MVRRFFNWAALSTTAIAAVLMCGSHATAQCDSGACGGGGGGAYAYGYADASASYASQGCASCASAGGGCQSGGCSFGYPGGSGGGCSSCGCGLGGKLAGGIGGRLGHHNGPLRQHASHLMDIHRRDYARNQAWPKPFDCADRQLYFSIWNPMLESGSRWNCIFTAGHFDNDTNSLNDAGISKLRDIYRNNPIGEKIALIQTGGNHGVADARLQSLRSTIDKYYGSGSFTEVAMATEFPSTFQGRRVETLNRIYQDQTAPPLIPVASGTGSTSDVGVGGG